MGVAWGFQGVSQVRKPGGWRPWPADHGLQVLGSTWPAPPRQLSDPLRSGENRPVFTTGVVESPQILSLRRPNPWILPVARDSHHPLVMARPKPPDHHVVPEPPTPPIKGAVLLRDALYLGDNGRITCYAHHGTTALLTGRDLSGQRMAVVTQRDAAEWLTKIGEPIMCEDCRMGIRPRGAASHSPCCEVE